MRKGVMPSSSLCSALCVYTYMTFFLSKYSKKCSRHAKMTAKTTLSLCFGVPLTLTLTAAWLEQSRRSGSCYSNTKESKDTERISVRP